MLTKLSIQNYALISDITIVFSSGLTTITGETGAGKSILLGGLGLILGKRADNKTLMNREKKCVIEGEFNVSNYPLADFFDKNDLDYEAMSIIRRELLPSGKSRAFINDTPVRLEVLSELQNQLIDVHSQHQTLQLNDPNFQFQLIDALANTSSELDDFRDKRKRYNQLQKEWSDLKEQLQKETEQYEYHAHLLREIETADFKHGEQKEIEQEVEKLSNIESILQNLSESCQLLSREETGLIAQLQQLKNHLDKIKHYAKEYEEFCQRIDSIYIETTDIELELESATEDIIIDPNKLAELNNRLQTLYNLFQKHQVNSIEELLKIKEQLAEKVTLITDADHLLSDKEKNLQALKNQLLEIGKMIRQKRKKIIPELERQLTEIVKGLGMPAVQFRIEISPTEDFTHNGMDLLQILFSANKGIRPGVIKQVASGGELSRIMLAIKSIIATHSRLPTIIFDEIDSGISGEIAFKMANILNKMSQTMQVISITHLPQIAAKGTQQMKVYKTTQNNQTHTRIKLLKKEERVHEIAEMLGGKVISETAENHAKRLLERV